ncbi:terminase small subunit [Solibacillus sp. FSL R7-0682]|uniref:terminase small subunit n=1 Tax=Solibacillus sp. FSL R7-0682 TaxID=2921690 RepID=UPI0030F6E72B
MIERKLTIKQQAFADYYIQTGNATEAAIKAGYSERSARQIAEQNLTKHDISNYIKEKMEEIASERIADATEVMEYLTKVMRREINEFVPMTVSKEESKWVDGKKQTTKEESVEIVEIPARLSDANKAAELLGKRYAMWTDKQEINANITPVFVDDISGDNNGG